MIELARAQGIRLPADTPDALAKAMLVRDAKSLEEYLQKYEITLSVLQTAQALERVAYEFVLDKAAENVRYVEVRYSPLLHRPALTLTQAIEAPLAGIRRASAETGTKVGLIVCAMRTRPPAESLELARAAAEYRDRKSTRLNSSHGYISYAVFCLKKKKLVLASPPRGPVAADATIVLPAAGPA